MVTNRIQDLIEFQGVYKGKIGFRTTASYWHDFAYSDSVHQTPGLTAAQVFGDSTAQAAEPDLTKLHAKIGQLTLENDFLESALTKAGLLSAKR